MITKHYIGGSTDALYAFLEGLKPEYFASVERKSDTIICKDSSGHVLYQIEVRSAFQTIQTFYTAHTSVSYSYDVSGPTPMTVAWKCKNGVFIDFYFKESYGSGVYEHGTLITKNNHGETCFVFSNYYRNPFTERVRALSWSDDMPLGGEFAFSQMIRSQTMFCPFMTTPQYGDSSYTPDAFYLPIRQDFSGTGEFTADGVKYWTNGFWAIRDE